MRTSIQQCTYHLAVANNVLNRLDDSHRALEPRAGAKTAGWLVGHLAVTGDFARHLCDSAPLCPRQWRSAFNAGSQPSLDAADYPSMSSLRSTMVAVYTDLCLIAATADPARLAGPNPYAAARASFPGAGDFVAYLMSSHLAYHVGQLTEWYAITGATCTETTDLQQTLN